MDTPEAVLAVVSMTGKHGLSTISMVFPRARADILSESESVQEGKPLRPSSIDSESTSYDAAHLAKKPDGDDEEAYDERKSKTSLTAYLSNDLESMMITYGDAAQTCLKRCISWEKLAVRRYELCLDRAQEPAIFVVDGGKRSQVVWSSTAAVRKGDGGQLHTIFPALLTFYPEVRNFVDAVILALVPWQMKIGRGMEYA
ncbi:hypothetical protein BV20DRAFT_1050026 [Pilatotrama ljubarskyi]|nr:hypothetical protein BV20DRAFT_1050026 [Pilatotrama ljubarskyi]